MTKPTDPARLAQLKAAIGEYVRISLDPNADPFDKATLIEPQLIALDRFVRTLRDGSLPTVENWVARFTRIFNSRPELADYRKDVFAHLLREHNEAVSKSQEAIA